MSTIYSLTSLKFPSLSPATTTKLIPAGASATTGPSPKPYNKLMTAGLTPAMGAAVAETVTFVATGVGINEGNKF